LGGELAGVTGLGDERVANDDHEILSLEGVQNSKPQEPFEREIISLQSYNWSLWNHGQPNQGRA
jgi:hypothetical protein